MQIRIAFVVVLFVVFGVVACSNVATVAYPKQYTCNLPTKAIPEVKREVADHSGNNLACGRFAPLTASYKPIGKFQKGDQLYLVYNTAPETEKPVVCGVDQTTNSCEEINIVKRHCCYDAAILVD